MGLVLSSGRLPPTDGESKWRYPQGAVMLRADDKEQLIQQIFQYRLRNNIPIGDIEADINRFYCNRFPRFCQENGVAIAPAQQDSWLNRITRWASQMVHQMPKGGYELEPSDVAEKRANVCVNCRFNIGWRGGCSPCASQTVSVVQQIKQLKKTKRDGNLSACAIGGWENSAAVWLGASVLTISDEAKARMPEQCWRKVV
jgi:hypothetical protein